jgi:hypothetical protein
LVLEGAHEQRHGHPGFFLEELRGDLRKVRSVLERHANMTEQEEKDHRAVAWTIIAEQRIPVRVRVVRDGAVWEYEIDRYQ